MTRTPEERAAMEWLDRALDDTSHLSLTKHGINTYLRPLKRMLGEPRVPDVNCHTAIDELHARINAEGYGIARCTVVRLIEIMREPPKPATKTVQVWRCESAVRVEGRRWSAHVSAHDDKESAENAAAVLAHGSEPPKREFACIRVTGPHDQEIPA